ncbi:hypothetical protein ITP53_16740 [Nonomuraea sp. K274]|uniref:Uncharacterized protein n=1 Tax=Nonomuraea cypriaca TaxID=1187855 RepID=A0A931A9A2_9ACTN|nr:hypothetical protein [Nonomuraea cypriaca]MBF8187350.1 hypothetical protein [Nonomuraea cypriaca]
MIRNIHVHYLRDQVDQAERDLAGWRFLLSQAEQGERAATVMPDPLMPVNQPWPAPPASAAAPRSSTPLFDAAAANGSGLPHGRDPYPTSVLPPIDGSTLPPNQENALGTIGAEHDAYSQTSKAVKEDQKWRAS